MPVSKSKRKRQTGQRTRAGRFGFSGFGSQAFAFRMLGRVGLFAGILILSGSTLADIGQKTLGASQHGVRVGSDQSYGVYGNDARAEMNRRHALLRYVQNRPGAIRTLHFKDLTLLFGAPSLEREDGPVRAWQFASNECALDVYYRGDTKRPVYAEYRVRGSAEHGGRVQRGRGGAAQAFDHRDCVRSLFVRAG